MVCSLAESWQPQILVIRDDEPGYRTRVRALALLFLLAPLGAAAQEDRCEGAKAALETATKSLQECLDVALGDCDPEQTERDHAMRAVDACSDPGAGAMAGPDATAIPTASPTPAPAIEGQIAVVVDGVTGTEQDLAFAAARLGLAGATLVDAGVVRAARAFLGSALDEASATRLREDIAADRLIILQVKPEGDTRFLAVRVFDPAGMSQRFAAATTATFPDEVRRLLAELPAPLPPAPAPTPPPVPTPAPVAVATPATVWDGTDSRPHPTPRPPEREPASPYVDIDVFGGSKSLDETDWAPLAAHGEAGILTTVGAGSWPVHLAGDYYYSFANGTVSGADVRVATTELCFGLRRVFELPAPMLRPHVGAGLAHVTVANFADVDGVSQTARGSALGFWAGAGAFLRLGDSVNLGVQARYSVATPDVNGRDVSAGGFHVGATLGFAYGAASNSHREYR